MSCYCTKRIDARLRPNTSTFAWRGRVGPPAGESLRECLLVEGSGNVDGQIVMAYELPEHAPNPAAVSEGGASLIVVPSASWADT